MNVKSIIGCVMCCSDKEKEVLIQTVKGVLKGTHKYREAASLCSDVLNDAQLTLDMYLLGKHWNEALYTARYKGLEHLIGT